MPPTSTPKVPTLSSDDTDAVRAQKLADAARAGREQAKADAEKQREEAEKAAEKAKKEKDAKPTAAKPEVAGGSEPHNPKPDGAPPLGRPGEVVKAGQSGHRARSTKLSRQQMEEVITKQGGSVLHNGNIISSIGNLPPEADLVDDPEAAAKLADRLEKQRDEIDAQIARLKKK